MTAITGRYHVNIAKKLFFFFNNKSMKEIVQTDSQPVNGVIPSIPMKTFKNIQKLNVWRNKKIISNENTKKNFKNHFYWKEKSKILMKK